MIPGLDEVTWVSLAPVKKMDIDESKSFVRFFHIAVVLVWVVLVSVDAREREIVQGWSSRRFHT